MNKDDERADYYADPVGHCLAALKQGNEHERFNAADILRGLAEDAEGAIPALVEAMRKDEGQQVRAQAGFALTEICFAVKERAAFIVPSLVEALLQDEDPEARSGAAITLKAIGPSAKSSIPALQQALHDEHEWVREAAQETLESFG